MIHCSIFSTFVSTFLTGCYFLSSHCFLNRLVLRQIKCSLHIKFVLASFFKVAAIENESLANLICRRSIVYFVSFSEEILHAKSKQLSVLMLNFKHKQYITRHLLCFCMMTNHCESAPYHESQLLRSYPFLSQSRRQVDCSPPALQRTDKSC